MKRNTSIPYKQIAIQQAREKQIINATQKAFMMMSIYTLYMDLDLTDEQIDLYIEKIIDEIIDIEKTDTLSNFTSDMRFVLEDDCGIKFDKDDIYRVQPSKVTRNSKKHLKTDS